MYFGPDADGVFPGWSIPSAATMTIEKKGILGVPSKIIGLSVDHMEYARQDTTM